MHDYRVVARIGEPGQRTIAILQQPFGVERTYRVQIARLPVVLDRPRRGALYHDIGARRALVDLDAASGVLHDEVH